jgi:hypothetical protein
LIWIFSHQLIYDRGRISLGCPSEKHPFKPFISKIHSIHLLLNIRFPRALAMWSISNMLVIVPNARSVIGNNHTEIFNNGHILAIIVNSSYATSKTRVIFYDKPLSSRNYQTPPQISQFIAKFKMGMQHVEMCEIVTLSSHLL